MRPSAHAHHTSPNASLPPWSIVRTAPALMLPAASTTRAEPDHLNVAERFAARVGEWVGVLATWCPSEYAPPFAGDARLAALGSAFAADPRDSPRRAAC